MYLKYQSIMNLTLEMSFRIWKLKYLQLIGDLQFPGETQLKEDLSQMICNGFPLCT